MSIYRVIFFHTCVQAKLIVANQNTLDALPEKMTKALSDRTVARFFHIDEKLDAAADIALAANIPLIH